MNQPNECEGCGKKGELKDFKCSMTMGTSDEHWFCDEICLTRYLSATYQGYKGTVRLERRDGTSETITANPGEVIPIIGGTRMRWEGEVLVLTEP